MPFVLANSVVSGWCLDASLLRDHQAWVPAIWELELTNDLRTACIRQRLDAARAAGAGALVAAGVGVVGGG